MNAKTAKQFGGDFSNEINFQNHDTHLEMTNCLTLYDLINNFISKKIAFLKKK